jgi:amino acid transporter, AAT family
LVSSGGFSLLLTYVVIVATHYRFRKKNGCPPKGRCQLPGFPYTSWAALAGLIAIIASMPLIKGQGSGLLAGVILVVFYIGAYLVSRTVISRYGRKRRRGSA